MVKRKLQEVLPEADWSNEEKLQLLQALEDQCPKHDKKSYTTRCNKVDWESVGVEGRTAEQCQAVWASLNSGVRKFRTLEEVVKDAKDIVLHPEKSRNKIIKHPDQPTRPLTAFFQFYRDHREKEKAKHPDLSVVEMAKHMSEKWLALNPAKRSKYLNSYLKQRQEFEEANERFLEQHPEFNNQRPKQPSPFGLYVISKRKSYKEKHPELSYGDVRKKLRKKYTKLSPEKKKKWIDRALAAVTDYEEEVRQYQTVHPDFEPPMKKVLLTRAEAAINGSPQSKNGPKKVPVKNKFPGAPKKPPRSAFALFVSKKYSSVEGSLSEKMMALGQKWKQLGDKQKKYLKKLNKLKAAYDEQLEEFKQSLTEEELAEFEESLKIRRPQ
ncbi:nucleolar transcription factor 1-like [Littorina saxatilis]|uniref:nucleolar transcription factor 1-like n=1 Tax=Littorina saxatilis TaxID=31220 RepID=UPI0038B43397